MQDVVKMCTTVGKEADTLKMKANSVLPVWQYNVGNEFINAKKYPQAITAYEKSREMAIAYSDDNIKEKAESMLAKLYVNNGNSLVNAQKYDDAIVQFEKGLKYDPNYSKGYYANAMAYKKKGNNAKMQENMDLAIASATKENDTVIVKAASNMVGSSLNQEGIAAYNKKSYTEAVTKLNAALGYGFKTKDLYYVLASSNNSLKKYDEAIEAAKSGLEMEEVKTNDKMARYYCEIAKAYEAKEDVGNACANYKKAAYGAFAQFSNAKIKNVLKCQ